MVQPVERNQSSLPQTEENDKIETTDTAPKSKHLQLINETNDPNVRVGLRFQAARKERDLTTKQVSEQLKIRAEYLNAIETMHVARLPKGFVNPYIREYAKFLELDPTKCIEDFNTQCGALSQACETELNVDKKTPDDHIGLKRLAVGAVICVLMAGSAFFGYQLINADNTPANNTNSPSIAIAADPATSSVLTSTGSNAILGHSVKLSIRANKRAWIEIRGADGTLFVDRHFSAGESYDLRLGAGWTLTTQNAGAFELLNAGELAGSLGEADEALYTMSVDNAYAATTAETDPLN